MNDDGVSRIAIPVAAASLVALALGASAQSVEARPAQPSADEVLDKWYASFIVDDQHPVPKTMVRIESIRIPAAHKKMTWTFVVDYENQRMVSQIKTTADGDFFIGVVDGVVWSTDRMRGARILKGDEADSLRSLLTSDIRTLFETKAYMGTAKVDGVPCHHLRLTQNGEAADFWFERKTGVLRKHTQDVLTEIGMTTATSRYSDFRVVEGYRLPYRQVVDMGPIREIRTTERVDFDLVLAPEQFGPPKAVKTLQKLKRRAARRRRP